MKKLILFLMALLLTGCVSIQATPSSVSINATNKNEIVNLIYKGENVSLSIGASSNFTEINQGILADSVLKVMP